MIRTRRLVALALLALALLLGQQAAALHELGHAIQATQDPANGKYPAPDTCEKCFAFAHLTGAPPAWAPPPSLACVEAAIAGFAYTPAQSRTVVAARSRAPPSLS